MLKQQKYLTALTISHVGCSLILANSIHSNLNFYMYIYMFLPIAILIATSLTYKYLQTTVQSILMYVVSFVVLAICIFMFWSNTSIAKEVFIHKPHYVCIIYLTIMIISAIFMPFTNPNGIFGIRIQQTMDYPEVWDRVHIFTSLILSSMILPTFISIFYLENSYSFLLCNIFLLGSLIIGTVYAVIITIPIEKAEQRQLEKELEDQIKKEQGYR